MFYLSVMSGGIFFELKQVVKKGETIPSLADQFRDKNVAGLWHYVGRAIEAEWFFKTDIFGRDYR